MGDKLKLLLLYFFFNKVAGILACNFTRTKSFTVIFQMCLCVLLIFVSSHSKMFSKITVWHLWLKSLKKYLWQSSIFIKAVGWRSEALLTMNFFTCILLILTTSGVQQLGVVQENSCSAPVARILEKIYVKEFNFYYKVVRWRQL